MFTGWKIFERVLARLIEGSVGVVFDRFDVGVFFVEDADTVDPATQGPEIEHNPLFPERTNVEFISILDHGRIRMRVWERGAGTTQACGSGACAVAVAAASRGLTARQVEVVLDGGSLFIDWRTDNHVVMSGPVVVAFTGTLKIATGAA